MAKNILTVQVDDLRRYVLKMNFSQLKNIMVGIYEFKWNNRNLNIELVKDLERKETIVEGEMMRKRHLYPKLYNEYFAWKRKMNYKKRYF